MTQAASQSFPEPSRIQSRRQRIHSVQGTCAVPPHWCSQPCYVCSASVERRLVIFSLYTMCTVSLAWCKNTEAVARLEELFQKDLHTMTTHGVGLRSRCFTSVPDSASFLSGKNLVLMISSMVCIKAKYVYTS